MNWTFDDEDGGWLDDDEEKLFACVLAKGGGSGSGSGDPPPDGFWRGPYGCLVPNALAQCVSKDGGNLISRSTTDGTRQKSTKKGMATPAPSESEWLSRFTVPNGAGENVYCHRRPRTADDPKIN